MTCKHDFRCKMSFYFLSNIPGEVLLKGKNFEKHTVFWLLQKNAFGENNMMTIISKEHFLVINVGSISTFWDE